MQNIQTIIFDLGGVILNLKTEQDWLQEDLLPNFEPDKLLQLQQNKFFHKFETGKINVADFLQQLKDITIDKNISEEKIIQYWNGILYEIPKHRVDLLKKLKEKYQLVLLSNTNEIHVEKFRKDMMHAFGEDILETNFNTVYFSQKIRMRKPDKEIYEFVMQEQNMKPVEILFFDDKAENLLEPQKIGWHTFHVNFNSLSIADLQHLLD